MADDIPKPDASLYDHVDHLMKYVGAPTNARMYMRAMMGEKSPVDEKYFAPDELAVIRRLVMQSHNNIDAENKDLERINQDPSLRKVKPRGYSVTYEDYPKEKLDQATKGDSSNPWYRKPMNPDLKDALTDPTMRVMTSLGRFSYKIDTDGNVIATDKYDFAPQTEQSANSPPGDGLDAKPVPKSPYGMLRRVGGAVDPKGGGHGYDVKLNLGNIYDWDDAADYGFVRKKAEAPTLPANMLAPVVGTK